jgi:hypothetical protein
VTRAIRRGDIDAGLQQQRQAAERVRIDGDFEQRIALRNSHVHIGAAPEQLLDGRGVVTGHRERERLPPAVDLSAVCGIEFAVLPAGLFGDSTGDQTRRTQLGGCSPLDGIVEAVMLWSESKIESCRKNAPSCASASPPHTER